MSFSYTKTETAIFQAAERAESKVRVLDSGIVSWPAEDWSVVLYPIKYFEGFEDYGALTAAKADEGVVESKVFVFTALKLGMCVSLVRDETIPMTSDSNILADAITSTMDLPGYSAPNQGDMSDFETFLGYALI